MATRLLKLGDGILVEAEVSDDEARPISSRQAKSVDETLASLAPLLIKVCQPIAASWAELNRAMNIEQAEVELGFSFEAEGNVYIARGKTGATLTVKLVLKPAK